MSASEGKEYLLTTVVVISEKPFAVQVEFHPEADRILNEIFCVTPREKECLFRTMIDNLPSALRNMPQQEPLLKSEVTFRQFIPLLFESLLQGDSGDDHSENETIRVSSREVCLGSDTIEEIMTFLFTDMCRKKMEKLSREPRGGGK